MVGTKPRGSGRELHANRNSEIVVTTCIATSKGMKEREQGIIKVIR
jgi:hypothetical protein